MGTTFVGVDGHGFWARDAALELWLRLLALHVADETSFARALRDQWLLASRGVFVGCIPHGLGIKGAWLRPMEKDVLVQMSAAVDRLVHGGWTTTAPDAPTVPASLKK